MTAVSGLVEAVSRDNTGIKVNGTWYNAKPETKEFVGRAKKGDEIRLEADENRAVSYIRIETQQTIPDDGNPVAHVLDEYSELMRLCKQKTDEIFGDDAAYKESMGQHCNSLFIAAERRLSHERAA